MKNIIIKNKNLDDEVITLKEITDLIEVRHNDAMRKVEDLAKEPDFGSLRKTRISHIKGKEIETYSFTKIQAIAVGARLNNTLLMKVIKRLEELENNKKPLSQLELIIQSAQQLQIIQDKQNIQEDRLFNLEQTRKLENWQEKQLIDSKNFKVYELAKKHDLENDSSMIRKLHSRVWKAVKRKFNVPRYNEVPSLKFDEANTFIRNLIFSDLV